MAKKSKQQKARNGESFLIVDEENIPMGTIPTNHVSEKYPAEFTLIDNMLVNQSAIFARDKLNVVNSIRNAIHKTSKKRYIVRRVDATHNRIWRVANNTVIRWGGRRKGGPRKKEQSENE